MHVTKTGDEITFQWRENVEHENRGWIVHRLTAFLGETEVGYLKVAYIPKADFQQRYPDLWHYLYHIAGWVTLNFESEDRLLDGALRYLEAWHTDEEIKSWTPAQRKAKLRSLEREAKRKHGKRFETFQAEVVDKPEVAYIETYGPYRRQGIGTALYLEGARRLGELFGLRLYASGLQQPSASAAWDKFVRMGLAQYEIRPACTKQRRYLDLVPARTEDVA